MKNIKKVLLTHFVAFALVFFPVNGRCDFWGGDIPLLIQIVTNTAQQLIQLRQILSTGGDTLNLLRDVNRGINDSLNIIKTVYPNADPGIYGNWDKVDQALQGVQQIYGAVAPSPNSTVEKNTDQSVAEAIALNNSIYKYTQDIDQIGDAIKDYSHQVSPGGAAKLTAQSMGIMLNVMNESLRAQATGLKIQAQTLALQNHKDKQMTQHLLNTSDELGTGMRNQNPDYKLPRFE